MKRRIVQIAVMAETENSNSFITALCNDGTLWTMAHVRGEWLRDPPIPQDEPAEENDQ